MEVESALLEYQTKMVDDINRGVEVPLEDQAKQEKEIKERVLDIEDEQKKDPEIQKAEEAIEKINSIEGGKIVEDPSLANNEEGKKEKEEEDIIIAGTAGAVVAEDPLKGAVAGGVAAKVLTDDEGEKRTPCPIKDIADMPNGGVATDEEYAKATAEIEAKKALNEQQRQVEAEMTKNGQ